MYSVSAKRCDKLEVTASQKQHKGKLLLSAILEIKLLTP